MGFDNFYNTKKDNTVCAVRNFLESQKTDFDKTIPSTEYITDAMLDLNMGHSTISLDPDAFKTCTVILQWVSILTCNYQWVLHALLTSSQLKCLS